MNARPLGRVHDMRFDRAPGLFAVTRLQRVDNRQMLVIRRQHQFPPIKRQALAFLHDVGAAAQDEKTPPKPLYLRRPDARPQDSGRLPRR